MFQDNWSCEKISILFKIYVGGDIDKQHVSKFKTTKFKYPIYANAKSNKGFYAWSDIFKVNEPCVTIAGRGAHLGIAIARTEFFYPIVRLLVLRGRRLINTKFFESALNKLHLYIESTGVPQLTAPQIGNYNVTYPSLPEQQKIADFLTIVDKKIQALEKKKALLEQYKKGVMQKIFKQEIRFKQEDGSDYPEWEEKEIGNVLKIGSGKDYKHLNTGEIPVYGTGGIMLYVDEFLYDGDSVGIGRKGTIDKPVFLKGKFWTVDTLFYTHSFVKILPFFVYVTFQTINWKKYSEASGVPSLSKSTIERIKVQVPTLDEQNDITNYLMLLDNKINIVACQVDKMKTWKKGLLQQMFV